MEDNEKEIFDSTDWNQLTFLEKKEEKKEIPALSKKDKGLSLFLLLLSLASLITLFALTLVYGTKDNPNFYGDRGYGYFGLILFLLFLLSAAVASLFTYLYDVRWCFHQKNFAFESLTNSIYYLTIALFYSAFVLIPLRPAVLEVSEVNAYLGLLLAVPVLLYSFVCVFLSFSKGKRVEDNLLTAMLVLLPLLFYPFSGVLIENYSLGGFAFPLLVSGSLSSIIGGILLRKKSFSSTFVGKFFLLLAVLFFASAILFYGMIQASPLY